MDAREELRTHDHKKPDAELTLAIARQQVEEMRGLRDVVKDLRDMVDRVKYAIDALVARLDIEGRR